MTLPLDALLGPLLGATALGAALVAGIFFAFSSFVMGALGRLAPNNGIAAMQSINVVVLNPWFFLAFFGTGALCLAAVVLSLLGEPVGVERATVLLGALLYLLGCLLVTVACNVPLNERLARADSDDADTVRLWNHYLVRWTQWNHVRTAASLAAAAVFAFSLAAA